LSTIGRVGKPPPVTAGAPSTFVISITPFTADGTLDEDGLRGHLRRLAATGIGVYLAGSGSGEGYTLAPAEVRRVLEIGAEELAGRVPVRAMGVEPRTATEMLALAKVVADVGLDAMQVYSLDQGHGNRPSDAEMERYYDDVLSACGVPVALSTHQSVGYLIPVDLIARLLDRHPHIVGVNCSTNDIPYLVQLLAAVDGRVDVHVGGPMHALTCLALGGQGFLSSDGNLTPGLCVEVIRAWTAGDLDACRAAYARVLRLFTATRGLSGIVGTKAALQLAGLPGGYPRLPRLPLPERRHDDVRRLLLADVGPYDPFPNP
jgi:4-hydroxy-tetrahydrodipicolinate synthase